MDKEPNNKNRLSLQSVRESLRTLSLSTLLLIVTTAVALVAVGSLAWMSENRKLDADGVHANMEGARYSISFPEESYQTLEEERSKIIDFDDSAMVWEMTDSANFNNATSGPQSSGVYPGSRGMVSFDVTPKADVDLDLTFELCAYVENTENGVTQLVPVTQTEIANFLNGHIMLFRGKVDHSAEHPANNGSYYYTDPILPNEDGERTVERIHFANASGVQTVPIYWEWPLTLSTIVYTGEEAAYKPFFSAEDVTNRNNEEDLDNDYKETLKNILNNPGFYLKDVTTVADAAVLSSRYDIYGDCYDRADNDIGNTIKYVLLKMTVSESEAAQGGGGN